MKMKLLTLEQTYTTMYIFLDKQYDKSLSSALGSLLSDMSTLDDGIPMDTAIWIDWAITVSSILGETYINKIMKPVIDVWKQHGIDVDITINKEETLFITATTLSHDIKIDQTLAELSTKDSLLPIFDDLRSYEKIIFRINVPGYKKKESTIVDKLRMKELRKLFHTNQQKGVSS